MKMKKMLAGLTAVICMAGSFAVFPELAGPVHAEEAVHNDFEVTYEGWYSDNATLTAEDGVGYAGTRGMQLTGRTSAEDGASSSKGFYLWGGVDYTYSVQVKADTDETFHVSLLTIDDETGEETLTELTSKNVKAGEWTKLSAKYEAPKDSYEFKLTITTDSTADFWFDEVSITTLEDTSKVYAAPAGKGLKDEFANYFLVGNILNGNTVKNSAITAIILKDHNAIECENETKPDATINANGSTNTNVQVHLNGAAAILDFAVKNNLAFRGHTLVWHSQTPEWFFKEGFNNNGAYVSASVMDQRMESYIKNMFALYEKQYPTLNLYAYDVCNEVIYDGTANNGGARPTQGDGRSAWVQVYGNNSFVEKAFTYARKYAPPTCKLFYNDYNEFANDKQNCIINTILKPLQAKGLIDGMGMQSHVNCAATNAWGDTVSYLAAMDKYLDLGLEVHVSELDLSTEGGKFSAQQQADKYKAIFKHAMDVNTSGKYKGGVTLVQVWGPNDANTWIKTENAPLLYDTNNNPKPAYEAITSLVPDSEWGDGSNPSVGGGEVKPVEPNEFGWFFHHRFEGDDEGWVNRGPSTIEPSTAEAYVENGSLYVSGRTDAWNGAAYAISPRAFVPGNEYSFSVHVKYTDGPATDTFCLKLEYTDASGETQYSTIDEGTAKKGEWMQLSNTNYLIPADATGMRIYVETADSTTSFYMDEAIGAVAGTGIQGEGKPDTGTTTPDNPGTAGKAGSGDVNGDGVVDVIDLTLAKRGVLKGFASTAAEAAADVDQSGKAEVADVVQLYKFIHKIIDKFSVVEKPALPTDAVDTAKMESIFASVTAASSWKKDGENNPLTTQRFGADPGFLVYKDRLYVYTTNDAFEYDGSGNIKENSYDVGTINCVSSSDLVNWTDHGAIPVAGRNGRTQNGAAKWASASWAPDACWKTINGKDKFFLYFANSAGGIGVLTADSPEGPWTDPIGGPLITKQTPNCGDVEWMFDPAVFVDDDGTGYIYFGGGVPSGKQANPGTGRCAKLGADMISLAGDPVRMEIPYLFEDSSILKIGTKYYYSYCTNWNVPGGTNVNGVSFNNADICYMVADNPLGPWTQANLKGNVFKNTATQGIDKGGNNHHSIVFFKNKYYVLYHSRQQEIRMGVNGGSGLNYRSTQLNEATYNAATGEITCKGDMKGVAQLENLNPYTTVQAECMSNQSNDISVTGLGDTVVNVKKGSWIKVSGVEFAGTTTMTVKGSSAGGAAIKVCTGSPTGDVIGYAEIPAGGSKEVTVAVNNISGTKDVYFVFSGEMSFDSWSFAK